MRLRRLRLRSYRNYSRLDLEPGPGLNIFLGANGQGKTNLLEAVALLALSASPRARRAAELVAWGAREATVEAEVEAGGLRREVTVQVALGEGERSQRRILVDGVGKRALDLPGSFRVTLFWPDDLALVKSGPEHRRRFLNHFLVQVQPGYTRALSGYTRVLEQRNSLLRRISAGDASPGELEAWDPELLRLGAEIVKARAAAVASLAGLAAEEQLRIAAGERLEIEYLGPPDDFSGAVHKSLAEDLRRGATSVGPHRDDLKLLLNGREARGFASQGQQRSLVVSLKLAEARLVRARSGEPPVLLLDDILSELDGDRRRALLEAVGGEGQVIITATEAESFAPAAIAQAQVWTIEQRQIVACG